jgi:hypothetical protein
MSTIKILFAAIDIGWRMDTYSKFLKTNEQNIRIKTFVKNKISKKQYDTNYDFEENFAKIPNYLQWIKSFFYFLKFLFSTNVFYFFSGETILTRKLRRFEFYVYRLLGKKIIMHFVGSDIRDYNFLYWKAANLIPYLKGEVTRPISATWQLKLIADCEEFASHILVSTPDLLSIVSKAKYFPVVIDVEKFNLEQEVKHSKDPFFTSEKIKVLHAPSNINLKGSKTINSVLKRIEKETELIEFIYTPDLKRNTGSLYTVSRYELFQLYNEADIVIDQLVIGWYGLQAIEAILAKCHVFCYIDSNLEKYLFPHCPIININALNFEEKLLSFIKNYYSPNRETNIDWVKKHHSIKYNNKTILDSIQGKP